ncbi:MAG: hypothetical protein H7X88_11420 [Gloeobacteraceae cyanobacterium ES-bin-316]|nr:hypothetical protein [Ferruginibacter sp.]
MPGTVRFYSDRKPFVLLVKAYIMLRHDFKVGEDREFKQELPVNFYAAA